MNTFTRLPYAAVLAVALLFSPLLVTDTQAGTKPFLVAQNSIAAPSGFAGICRKYGWVCKKTGHSTLSDRAVVSLAKKINRQVNRQIPEIEDLAQYGRAEHWALPTRRGGDCEDLVLLKKKMLVAQGVPSEALLIATVLDKKMRSHAVLVLRTSGGDMVLDNLIDRMLPWQKTGYTFLKLQNPKALARWDAVLAGGVIRDTPTASR